MKLEPIRYKVDTGYLINKFILFLFLANLPFQSVIAHPVVYKGAYAVMTYNQPFLSDHWVNYSFRPDMAIVARGMRMKLENNESSLNVYMPQLDYLVKRWYGEDYQANLYVWGGFGGANLHGGMHGKRKVWSNSEETNLHEGRRRHRRNGSAGLVGVEADAESRKYFGLFRYEVIPNSLHKTMHQVEVRLGIAPYEAEYCEIASWFMISARYNPDLKRNYSITPLARFFYKSMLWETGVSFKGDWMLNFMFHF